MENICKLCKVNKSKYICPKCKVNYCSLDCFKSNNHILCSEEFYKNNVLADMDESMSTELREKIQELIDVDNLITKNEKDNEASEALEDRIGDLDLNKHTDEIWQVLTDEERKDFHKFLESDDIKKYIEIWKPWWIFDVVEEVDAASNSTKQKLPKPMKKIVGLTHLTSKPPNKLCKYLVVESLICYCYVCRRYNGDHQIMSNEVECVLMDICEALLCKEVQAASMQELVGLFVMRLTDKKIQCNTKFLLLLLNDLDWFLKAEVRDKQFVLFALSDMRRIFDGKTRDSKICRKKLEFLINFVSDGKFREEINLLEDELEIAKMMNRRI